VRYGFGPVPRWWRRRGLRARVTLTAALGLIVAFTAADLLLFNALRVSLTRSVDDSARSGAVEVQALINANRGLPNPVPVPEDITIQVLNSSGAITNVSSGGDRLVPIVSVAQARALAHGGGAMQVRGAPFDMPSLLRVVVVPANGGQLVIAAVPFSEASGSLSVVARTLVIFTPVLFLVFTGAIWLVTGSTLRPIGALRRGAARVTATAVPSDLPVPEARDEVRLLALTLNDMLTRLAEAQQRQRALVSDTAQDLLLLARLDEQAGQAGQARPGGGMSVDLAELCRSVVCRYADSSVPVTVVVPETTAPGGSVAVAGDWARLDRLIVNLVDNAVRYAKSSVVVSVTGDGSWAELAVTDDGPGIPTTDRERAFGRFARLDDARSREGDDAGGAGLGLAIVRATAQAYGGMAVLEPATPSDDVSGSVTGLRAVVRLPAIRDGA
jgi:signal transduction histidine kinase